MRDRHSITGARWSTRNLREHQQRHDAEIDQMAVSEVHGIHAGTDLNAASQASLSALGSSRPAMP